MNKDCNWTKKKQLKFWSLKCDSPIAVPYLILASN